MNNLINLFTDNTKVCAYSDLTTGQSNLANVLICLIAVILFSTIIRNKLKIN